MVRGVLPHPIRVQRSHHARQLDPTGGTEIIKYKLISNLAEVQGSLRHHLNDAESPSPPTQGPYPYTEIYAHELRDMLKLIIECRKAIQ